jgi:hypothetical protein
MKNNYIYLFGLYAVFLLLSSCEPEKKMLVATGEASNILDNNSRYFRGDH